MQSPPSLAFGVLAEASHESTDAGALGDMRDKQQLLVLFLDARFRRPLPIILIILVGMSSIAMVDWMLMPDKVDDVAAGGKQPCGVFGTIVAAFVLAEMGGQDSDRHGGVGGSVHRP